jgi:hypothetical protein
LKLPQTSNLDESTLEISHPYSNVTYTIDNTKPELHHLPFNDMQSYDIENENETRHSLMKQIFIHHYTLKPS